MRHKLSLFEKIAFLVLLCFGILCLGEVLIQYVANWHVGFSSDAVLFPLTGKHILELGERPVYVPGTGYQGILLSSYLSAFYFNVFGITPQTMNFSPVTFLTLGMFAWFEIMRRAFDLRIAVLTFLATTLSYPFFYKLVTRAYNYSEILLLGSLFFVCFVKAVHLVEAKKKIGNGLLVAMGLLTGFGTYTVALFLYFPIACGLAVLLQAARPFSMAQLRVWTKLLFFPWKQMTENSNLRAFYRFLAKLGWVVGISGLVALLFFPERVTIGSFTKKLDPLAVAVGGFAAVFLPSVMPTILHLLRKHSDHILDIKRAARVLSISAFIGYLPAIYHKLFIGEESLKKMGFGGSRTLVKMRIESLIRFHEEVFHAGEGWLSIVTVFFCLMACLWFLRRTWRLFKGYADGKNQTFSFEILMLLYYLATMILFFTATSSGGYESLRYVVLTLPFFGFVFAQFTLEAFRTHLFRGVLCSVGFVSTLYLGWVSVQKDLRSPKDSTHELIAKAMQDKNITVGYADYWLAYATVFLTHEKVVLEPVYSNYFSQYGPKVAAASRIAYVDFIPQRLKPNEDGTLLIGNTRYFIESQADVTEKVKISYLEKAP